MLPDLQKQISDYINAKPPKEGWCSKEKALALSELIIGTKPTIVLEIGVFGGRSLIPQAMALRDNNIGKIYGIDPWNKASVLEGDLSEADKQWWATVDLEYIHRHCMENIWAHQLDDWATILRCASQQCVNLFRNLDILHIDGQHSEVSSCRDVQLYVPLVKKGGYVWFDDLFWPTTQKAVGMLDATLTAVKDVDGCRLYRKTS